MQAVPFLMSVSIATPAENASSDEKEFPKGFPFCIKNTFIDVFDDFNQPTLTRRSASAPPTPRGSDSSSIRCFSPLKSPGSWSGASTPSAESSGAGLEVYEDSCGESVASESVGVTLTLAELLPPPTAPSRTKLNTGAKVWAPNTRGGSSLPMPPDVKNQFAEIVAAAQAALMGCACFEQVGSIHREEGWFLHASCQQADLLSARGNLAIAKQAMLRASEKSGKIYILGYEKVPFAESAGGLGFTAKLALVDDESAACWDLLTTGACCRGCKCRWQHPAWQMSVSVFLKASNL